MKILVVDDNPDMTFTVVDGLCAISDEYKFHAANSGAEALKIAKKDKIDMILLDIMMPGMDGWTVAAELKSDPKTTNIPIIFLTARTDDLSKGMASLIAADYLEKPFDATELDKRIRAVFASPKRSKKP